MHKLKLFVAAGAFALVGFSISPAYSQSTPSSSRPWMGGRMDTNLYLGGSVGQATYRSSCDGIATCDDRDTAWKVFAGYQFHRNFALEGGYFNLGKVTASDVIGGVSVSADAKVSGLELTGVGILPITQQLALFAKLGVARTRVRLNATGTLGGFSAAASEKHDSTDLTFGLGGQYNFDRNIAARLEWQRYNDVGGGNIGKEDIDLYAASLMYRF